MINKRNQKALFKTFNASKDANRCIKMVSNYQETVLLHKVMVGDNKIAIFHHLVSTGGNLYDQSSKEYGFSKASEKQQLQ